MITLVRVAEQFRSWCGRNCQGRTGMSWGRASRFRGRSVSRWDQRQAGSSCSGIEQREVVQGEKRGRQIEEPGWALRRGENHHYG